MRTYSFKLVNVFAKTHFGGNPLAVFPQADNLTDDEMQQIAKQFNLNETVFAFSSETAIADLRIFTPEYELPLAGHPTLGSAFVLKQLYSLSNSFILNTQAKTVHITIENETIEMAIEGYTISPSTASQEQLANSLGLLTSEIAPTAYWLNSGSPQLLLQLLSPQAIEQVKVNYNKLSNLCQQDNGRTAIYIWYEDQANGQISSRFFYGKNSVILEDRGTGSACANLGAYFLSQGKFPLTREIHQGDQIDSPNRLSLRLDEKQTIYVGGNVIEVGEGYFKLP